jgi:hypothetical protein
VPESLGNSVGIIGVIHPELGANSYAIYVSGEGRCLGIVARYELHLRRSAGMRRAYDSDRMGVFVAQVEPFDQP